MYSDSVEANRPPNFGSVEDNHEWNSRLLKSKAHRMKIEDNVVAQQNRITFLENEECKLLVKIENTKHVALEVINIKRYSRNHNDMLDNAKEQAIEYLHTRKEEVHDMKQGLDNGMRGAYKANQSENLSKADEVKNNLNSLKNQYTEHKRAEQRDLIEKCNAQKQFEKDLDAKKERIQVNYNFL